MGGVILKNLDSTTMRYEIYEKGPMGLLWKYWSGGVIAAGKRAELESYDMFNRDMKIKYSFDCCPGERTDQLWVAGGFCHAKEFCFNRYGQIPTPLTIKPVYTSTSTRSRPR